MAITLSELITIYRQQTNSFPHYYNLESENNLFQNLNLLVRQKRLGLNITPFLENYPEVARYLLQLERVIPELFNRRKKIYLNQQITAKLPLNEREDYWLQISVNLAKARNRYLLITWSFKKFKLSFNDRVNLWATCKYLNTDPTNINLVHYFLSIECKPTSTVYRWNNRQQTAIQKLLKTICLRTIQNISLDSSPVDTVSADTNQIINEIESIEELIL